MIKFTTKKREDEIPTNKLMVTDTNNGCKVYELEDILSLMVDDFEFYTINDKHLDIHIFVKAKNYVRYGYGNTIIANKINKAERSLSPLPNTIVKHKLLRMGEHCAIKDLVMITLPLSSVKSAVQQYLTNIA